ncbi:hypothetical protein KR059_005494, partial [Drosophila kikkawai]
MNLQEKLAWFFGLKSVRYAQIFIVVTGDLLALSNLYPKHSMYIRRPFLLWEDLDDKEDLDGHKKQ